MSQQGSSLPEEQQIYADLLDETRTRIDFVTNCIKRCDEWPPIVLQEFCYLQYRMLCEYIAIMCMIAHGDIKTGAAMKEWRPPDIIERLQTLDPNFYPKGIRIVVHPETKVAHLEDYNVPQLTKEELVKLWERSGDVLHLGKLKRVLRKHGKDIQVNVTELMGICQKIINLLDNHVIFSAVNKTTQVAMMSSAQFGGKVGIWFAAGP